MRSSVVLAVLTAGILPLPITASAQEATLIGQVTDTTGGVLPGVVVNAVHEATGNTSEVTTDGLGRFRIPARLGAYAITATLPGFTTVERTGVSLQIGQEITVNLEMSVSALEETVTVTGEAPLVNPTNTRQTGIIDTRQMEELPINGRNLMDLALMAKGQTANHTAQRASESRNRGDVQVQIDGQQVTNQVLFRLAPQFSRDAIAEFEFIANRFDATMGRTHGAQLNAITKSGTNQFSGSFAGYFRDDAFNAADFIAGEVLPYQDQQYSGTLGGPIVQNRAHFFVNYEYEREPHTLIYTTAFESFNIQVPSNKQTRKALVRGDFELTSQARLSVRYASTDLPPYTQQDGTDIHPSTNTEYELHNKNTIGTLTNILSNRTVNEFKVGYSLAWDSEQELLSDPTIDSRLPSSKPGNRHSCYTFRGRFRIGGCQAAPTDFSNEILSIRNQLTMTYGAAGAHTLKVGGEYLSIFVNPASCGNCYGNFNMAGPRRSAPIPDNIEELFPVTNDISTWNLTDPALLDTIGGFEWIVGDLNPEHRRPDYAFWIQDDWIISPRLTLNLGLRYDFSVNKYDHDVDIPPFLPAGRTDDLNNFAPRLGLAFSPDDLTVVRGGFGIYFAGLSSGVPAQITQAGATREVEIDFDGRADFLTNPFNGPAPTFETFTAQGLSRSIIDPVGLIHPEEPFSYQASVGIERQIGDSMAISIDLLIDERRNDGGFGGRPGSRGFFVENVNLFYDEATGANPEGSRRSPAPVPFPDWGAVGVVMHGAESSRRTLEFGFQKRFSDRWQAAADYQFGRYRDFFPQPLDYCDTRGSLVCGNIQPHPFQLAGDFDGDWRPGAGDQRHRFVFNGIVEVGAGVQVSGLYFYGSGKRFNTVYGAFGGLRGTTISADRLRGPDSPVGPEGSIIPRNNFLAPFPIHRMDVRLQKRFSFGGVNIDGFAELYNVFNHENFGRYNTEEVDPNYGAPRQEEGLGASSQNPAYSARSGQLGFRISF